MVRQIMCVLTLAVLAGSAWGVTSYSTDFSEFSTGSFVGQQGWLGNAVSGLAGGSHLDEEIVDLNGNKVFRLSNAVTSGNYSYTHPTPPAIALAGESATGATHRQFTFSFDFRSTTADYQEGLVLTSPVGYRHSTASRNGLLYLSDTPTGLSVTFWDVMGGAFRSTVIGGLARTEWHTVSVSMLFNDGLANDVAALTINGVDYTGLTTWEQYYATAGGPQPVVEGVDGIIFRAAGAPVGSVAGGGFYFDNVQYSVSAPIQAIPEPLTMASLLSATAGLASYLRRRR